ERRQGADHRGGLHEVRPCSEHMRDGCAHRILSVHQDPLPSAAVTTSGMHPSPRALTLAASIGWRHAAADPVRALLLAWRVLPAPLRGWLRLAGPYGRAAVLWGAGDRVARDDRHRPVLTARLAWREGRLTDALRALDSAPSRSARRLRATLTVEQ